MVYFVVVVFVLGIVGCLNEKVYPLKKSMPNIYLIITIAVVLILIATFRNPSMRDYMNYYDFFLNGAAEWKEPTLTYIATITSKNQINPLWAFFLFACISVILKLYDIIKLSPLFWSSFIVWIGGIFILHDMIQIRAAVASGILIWSVRYIYVKNRCGYFISVILATLFHYSAIIFIIFYFLNIKKSYNNIYILLIPVSYILLFCGLTFGNLVSKINISSIQTLYNFYKLEEEPLNIFNSFQLLRIITATILVAYINKIKKCFPLSIIIIKIYVIGICSLVLLSDITTFAIRISELILSIEILAVPLIVFLFNPKQIYIGKLYVIGYSSFFLFMEIIYQNYLSIY